MNKLVRFLILAMSIFSIVSCGLQKVKYEDVNIAEKPAEEIVDVEIIKFEFVPKVLTIKKGQKVRWINKEKRQYHSVWFDKNNEPESEYLFPGDVLVKEFNVVGSFEYICGPHPKMTGIIQVQ